MEGFHSTSLFLVVIRIRIMIGLPDSSKHIRDPCSSTSSPDPTDPPNINVVGTFTYRKALSIRSVKNATACTRPLVGIDGSQRIEWGFQSTLLLSSPTIQNHPSELIWVPDVLGPMGQPESYLRQTSSVLTTPGVRAQLPVLGRHSSVRQWTRLAFPPALVPAYHPPASNVNEGFTRHVPLLGPWSFSSKYLPWEGDAVPSVPCCYLSDWSKG